MEILNMDRSRCGLALDLADRYPVEPGRYTIVQSIEDGYATYQLTDNSINAAMQGDKWHDLYTLQDIDGNTFRVSGRQIVRAVYDSALCVDSIPDLPGEQWKFIGLPFTFQKETSLVSNYGRIKSYADYNAILRHPVWNESTGYWEIKFGNTKKERPTVHRLVGYYFVWQRDRPDLPFDQNLDIHHIATRDENQAWNLTAMPKSEHIELHARLKKAGINCPVHIQ